MILSCPAIQVLSGIEPHLSVPRMNANPEISPYLGNVINRPAGGRPPDRNSFRRYMSVVQTSTTIDGIPDIDRKRIFYEVGSHYDTAGQALAVAPATVLSLEASHNNGPALSEEFKGLAKKYSNFSGRFDRSSLCGVVERIARGLAAWSLFEGVTGASLQAGQPIHLTALDVWTSPVEANRAHVFIPRVVDTQITPEVFSILVLAIAGEGGRVATDRVQVDANTNQPYVPDVDNDAFPRACVDALRVLGSNYAEGGAGDLFCLALTKGLHHVLTVVGHTDEGGFMRSVLRRGCFEPPYGAVHGGLPTYIGLPALSSVQAVAVGGYVDSLALMTAGLVAHCDPGVIRDGEWFPSIFTQTTSALPVVRPGNHQASVPAGLTRCRNAIVADFGRFAALYVPSLCKLFGFGENSGIAQRALCAFAGDIPADERHLQFVSVAPYFWVEPTSLIDPGFCGTMCESEGFGSYGAKMSSTLIPAWEACSPRTTGVLTHSLVNVKMRSARTSGFIAHFNGHAQDGLGAVFPRQLDPGGIIHPGNNVAQPEVRDRLDAQVDMAGYLWTRGQSPFPAPAELVNTGLTMGLLVRHMSVADDGDITVEHMVGKGDLPIMQVRFDVGIPRGLPIGASNAGNSDARRARTRAAVSLDQVRLRARVFGTPDIDDMPVMASAPGGSWLGRGGERDDRHQVGGLGVDRIAASDAGHFSTAADSRGERLFPTVLQLGLRGPTLPNRGSGGGGGPGSVPPAGPPGGGPPGGGGGGTGGGGGPSGGGGSETSVPRAPPAPGSGSQAAVVRTSSPWGQGNPVASGSGIESADGAVMSSVWADSARDDAERLRFGSISPVAPSLGAIVGGTMQAGRPLSTLGKAPAFDEAGDDVPSTVVAGA